MTNQEREEEMAPALSARALMRANDAATLATAMPADAGANLPADAEGQSAAESGAWPYASLVLVACDFDASPILLLSTLAEHTQNILKDDRVALLYDGTGGSADRLSGARLSVLGRARGADDPRAKARYLARHPAAAAYAQFSDFGFFRVAVTRAHLVAGFGRINWVDGPDLTFAQGASAALADGEADLIAEMNEVSPKKLRVLAAALGLDGDGWRMTGCDPEGCDLRREGEVARFVFPSPVSTPTEARTAIAQVRG